MSYTKEPPKRSDTRAAITRATLSKHCRHGSYRAGRPRAPSRQAVPSTRADLEENRFLQTDAAIATCETNGKLPARTIRATPAGKRKRAGRSNPVT